MMQPYIISLFVSLLAVVAPFPTISISGRKESWEIEVPVFELGAAGMTWRYTH